MSEADVRRPLEGFVKLALNLRLVALFLTVLWLPSTDPAQLSLVTTLLACTGVTSVVPILAWQRVGRWVIDHPVATVPDLLLSVAVLALLGFETPFGLFVASTALVSGALYGVLGAIVIGSALLMAWIAGLLLSGDDLTVAAVAGTPALIPAAAAGGAAVRELLVRQERSAAALAEASLNQAASVERTRLAREMHDTLAKTLHGIALSATALPELLRTAPDLAVTTAANLAGTAERAAQEARALITDLRQDDLERPLGDALREAATTWAARTGVRVELDLEACAGLSPSARYELFCVAREALRNAREHGEAEQVDLTLRDGSEVTLTIRDDGRGFTPPADLHDLAVAGHFGVIGMRERAESVGGRLALVSRPGDGTSIEVVVPRTTAGEREGQLPPAIAGQTPEGAP